MRVKLTFMIVMMVSHLYTNVKVDQIIPIR